MIKTISKYRNPIVLLVFLLLVTIGYNFTSNSTLHENHFSNTGITSNQQKLKIPKPSNTNINSISNETVTNNDLFVTEKYDTTEMLPDDILEKFELSTLDERIVLLTDMQRNPHLYLENDGVLALLESLKNESGELAVYATSILELLSSTLPNKQIDDEVIGISSEVNTPLVVEQIEREESENQKNILPKTTQYKIPDTDAQLAALQDKLTYSTDSVERSLIVSQSVAFQNEQSLDLIYQGLNDNEVSVRFVAIDSLLQAVEEGWVDKSNVIMILNNYTDDPNMSQKVNEAIAIWTDPNINEDSVLPK